MTNPKYIYRKDDGFRFTLQSDGKYTMDNNLMAKPYRYEFSALNNPWFCTRKEDCDMKKPKQYKVTLQEKPFLNVSGDWVDMPFKDFVDMAGGELAIALFKGDFQSKIYQLLDIAHQRGKKLYHEQLIAKE